ncbi:hydroxyisourate hydrolase [Deinococcus sp.]|uniref:hydroxyisourate hydrolase n=1 Tax=Deinococcus sp. TaxID=47478 RepID=UPI0025E6E91A|nr:hydroxyisourate hydrolase [Deinococcus sp.]
MSGAGSNGVAGLSTHVLDTARGCPAPGIALELYLVGQGGRQLLTQAVTNADGRTDAPLIERGQLLPGTYELEFRVAAYFAGLGAAQLNPGHLDSGHLDSGQPDSGQPPFLDVITLRFTVADTARHYHVPLLVSPWSYSTYRGS